MTLSRMNDTGGVFRVKRAPEFDLYGRYKREAPPVARAAVAAFVAKKISEVPKFSIATLFPDPWPPELKPVWDFCLEPKLAAFVLAYIVMETLFYDSVEWKCTKTNIQERDFESNFYWR